MIGHKAILETFLHVIEIISDEEYQQRVWIEGRGPECHDYDEFVNYFFLEGVSIISQYKEFGITEKQHDILKKFEMALDSFENELLKVDSKINYHPAQFTNSVEWKQIVEIAKDILIAFNYQKKCKY